MTKVALSGAGGTLGTLLRAELPRRGIDLRAGGHRPLAPLRDGEDVVHGDLRDPAAVDRLLQGVDVLVHLAGTSVERPLPEIIENNLVALYQIYEGARRNQVRRVIFASSNHAFGMYPVDEKLAIDAPYRPDGFYGLSKVWGEAMGRMYWDKHGIEGVALRIGTAMGRPPENLRQLSTWLGAEDLVDLVLRCIEVPDVGYLAAWGVSNNTRAYYEDTSSAQLGYHPRQDAEAFAPAIVQQAESGGPVAAQYQGGQFASIDFTPLDRRPRRKGPST